VARTKRLNLMARLRRHPPSGSASAAVDQLNELPADECGDLEALEWKRSVEQRLLNKAAAQVRNEVNETTWLAFQRTAIEGLSPQAVAAALGMNVGAVYAARCRVQARLRTLIRLTRCDQLDE
jgi:RNA polymerase sigma-70 factor (ECF subfamily)